ncbi:hypothetical protein NE865_08963 [Phthorimaea operculella]|nr:hypothetical protein NE865_08963 [Phthorimaea operculella]
MSSKCFATVAVVLALSYISESYQDSFNGKKDSHKSYNSLATLIKSKNLSKYNVASDKDERTILLPKVSRFIVTKQRKPKKVPMRSTIQKIIKKTKKSKKAYRRATRPPTQPTRNEIRQTPSTTQPTQHKKSRKFNSKYVRYPMPFHKLSAKSAKKDYTVHRKNRRSVNRIRRDIDLTKSHVDIIQTDDIDISGRDETISDMDEDISKKDADVNRLNIKKRNVDRDLYILEDLDEIEFLSDEKDENTIKAHVKNYW